MQSHLMEDEKQIKNSLRRCEFYLHNKRRFCANSALANSQYCGNHNPSTNDLRVPCPLDPSHSVLKESLGIHMKRCPHLKQSQKLESQPYYSKGINAGPGDHDSEEFVSSEAKRSYLYSLSVAQFFGLVDKIKKIHSLINELLLPESLIMSSACEKWLKKQMDRKMPYQEKHVVQQASILGNMEAFAILKQPADELVHNRCDESSAVPAVIEFGAGRGYLTQMLADCYGIKKVFLVERKSYKLKADRSLRQDDSVTLERLRIDIEDLNLQKIESLQSLPYLAIGKHLCGPASDLMIRCCLPDKFGNRNEGVLSTSCYMQGLALATCCHHLCQWKHYINRAFLTSMGITKEEFHAITWFSSWAVDADHSTELAEVVKQGYCLSTSRSSSLEDKAMEEITRNIPAVERAGLGFMCKEIIDIGRLLWLREHGLDARHVKYVPSNVSPENHLLLAKLDRI